MKRKTYAITCENARLLSLLAIDFSHSLGKTVAKQDVLDYLVILTKSDAYLREKLSRILDKNIK